MIPSPCNRICAIDEASGLCRGCARTLAEIAEWGTANETRQREILAALAKRKPWKNSPTRSP